MIKDYHMHPQVLRQPETFDDFVKTALSRGVREICVTDHMPLKGSGASDRIPHGKIREYCASVRRLAREYSGRLSIKLGIEMDYHPSIEKEIEAVLEEGEFDFVLGSSHLHALSSLDIFHTLKTRGEYAEAMLQNTASAAESGYFNAIAHVDMYHWIFSESKRFPLEDDGFSEKRLAPLIDQTLEAVKKNGLYLEINPHFALACNDLSRVYPSAFILQRAFSKGIRFSFGSDAHVPQHVGAMLKELRNHPFYGRALKDWETEERE